jgi:hypothetical protein
MRDTLVAGDPDAAATIIRAVARRAGSGIQRLESRPVATGDQAAAFEFFKRPRAPVALHHDSPATARPAAPILSTTTGGRRYHGTVADLSPGDRRWRQARGYLHAVRSSIVPAETVTG